MDTQIYLVFGIIAGYILGSIPTSVWIGKFFYSIDIRNYGSGNAGATNAMRVLGIKAAIIVLLVDFLKGIGAVAIASAFKNFFTSNEYFIIYQLTLGIMAMLGHMFPVFANFKGGKGVATLSGIVLAVFPVVFLICLGVFISVFIPTRYVSLSSIAAAIAFPLFVIFVFKTELMSKVIFSILTTVILLITHRKNIHRLIKGMENKILFKT